MNTLRFTLAEDWRLFRWLLPAWIAVLWAYARLQAGLATGPEDALTWLTGIIALSWGVVWLILLSLLAFNHPSAELRAAWRVRPLRGEWVAVAKMLTGAVVLVLVPAVAGVLTAQGGQSWPISDLAARIAQSGALHALFFFLLLLVASLCRTSRHFLGATVGIFVGMPLALTVGLVSMRSHRSVQLFDYSPIVGWLVAISTVVLAVGLTLRQYRRPRTRQHLLIIGGYVAGLALLETILPANPNDLPRLPVGDATMTATPPQPYYSDKYRTTEINFAGLDPHAVWQLNEIRALPTQAEDRRSEFDDNLLLPSPGIAEQLGLPGYTIEQTQALPYLATLEIADPAAAVSDAPDQVSAKLARLRLEVLGTLPGHLGSALETDTLRVRITGDTEVIGGPGVTLELFAAARPSRQSRISHQRPPMWVWVDHSARRAWIVKLSTGPSHFTNLSIGLRGTFSLQLPVDWDVDPAALELRIVDVLPEGEIRLRTAPRPQ
ncbi:hypothetical protein [Actomonas aquatica]|uniref:ABC transporter permease n=1 Tax=Actomonas aquatica TaxID=2866162 RepID=A0ABZ1C4G9_9BACT|nr:hypothetical protein [Opitutus sp. WL0086]WRQ86270.1 hypothetical protein K1X11_015755 [Opitutus sp. WL0086]